MKGSSLLLGCLLAVSASAQTVDDARRGFSFAVPAGYEPAPEVGAAGGALYAYLRGKPPEGSWAMLVIAPLGGTIAEGGKLNHSIAEKAANEVAAKSGLAMSGFTYRQVRWGAHLLEVMASHAVAGERQAVTLATQVPLASEAIQVQLVGDGASEAKLSAEFDTFLTTLHGKSNWQGEAERDRRRGERVGFIAGLAIVPAGAVVALAVFFWQRRRKRTAVS